MTSDPDDPNRPFEYPSLEESPPSADPFAPVDHPVTSPPPPSGFPPPFPSPYLGYGSDPYDPYRPTRPPGTNGQAVGALVAALVGIPLCVLCGIPSIVAIVLGLLAMDETKRTGQEGHGMALAAVIIGALTLALLLMVIVTRAATFTITGN